MKKIILSLVFALLAIGSAIAAPQFRSIDNENGKTTVKIEFQSSEFSQTTIIKDWKLYNNGKVYAVKKVDVKGKNGEIFVLEFAKLTKFSDCVLYFTVNGEPASVDIHV